MKLNCKALLVAIGLSCIAPVVSAARVTVLSLPTSDIAYDLHSGRIYASVPSIGGPGLGNTVTAVDPASGNLTGSVFVGSEPGPLAISDDGQYLYAGLNGAGAIRQVHLPALTATLQFSLGVDAFTGPYFAEDIDVMPGSPGTIAVSLRNFGFSPRHEGVAIFDSGVQRPNVTPGHTGSNAIEFGASASILYGYNNETTEFGLRTMTVNAAGVQTTNVVKGLISGFGQDIEYADGRLYATGGRVIDPVTSTLLGTYPAIGPVEPDASNGLTYFLTGAGANTALKIFDLDTFVLLDLLSITGVQGNPSDLIRWGDYGLAFRTSADQLVLLDLAPVPLPAALWLFGSAFGTLAAVTGRRRYRWQGRGQPRAAAGMP